MTNRKTVADNPGGQRRTVPDGLKPMEADTASELPRGAEWHYEPKYDGFRCLAFKQQDQVRLQSRNRKALNRYFPEVVEGIREARIPAFIVDGELLIPGEPFETLQLRLHPAASRVEKLADEHPAALICFDLLSGEDGLSLLHEPFSRRRAALEKLFARLGDNPVMRISDATRSADTARAWFDKPQLDGIMAKRLDLPYSPGKRAMIKYKKWLTVDCVVGGLYRNAGSGRVESLLLGLYDDDGKLNYVGRSRVREGAAALERELEPLIGGSGFTGRAPGGKSRWSDKERKPVPLKPVLVAEVSADHITGDYMRHGARLLRWREDKRPEDCTMDQIRQPASRQAG